MGTVGLRPPPTLLSPEDLRLEIGGSSARARAGDWWTNAPGGGERAGPLYARPRGRADPDPGAQGDPPRRVAEPAGGDVQDDQRQSAPDPGGDRRQRPGPVQLFAA